MEGEDIRREVSESSSSDVEEEKEEERSGCCEVGGGVDFVVVDEGDDDVEGEGEVVVRSSEEEDMLSLEVCWGGGRESIVAVDLMGLVVVLLTWPSCCIAIRMLRVCECVVFGC